MRTRQAAGWGLVLGLCAYSFGADRLRAQEIRLDDAPAHAPARQFVSVATDAVEVKAEQPAWVELRFLVDAGKHINSHTPHDELLIPTTLEAGGGAGIEVLDEAYPAGMPLRLEVGAGELLSTYQGEFRVRVKLLAAHRGEAVLAGALRYQACDAHSCFPPRRLPLRVAVAAR